MTAVFNASKPHKLTWFEGGRDTERELYGATGGYLSLLPKNTWREPCPVCGAKIVKEPYWGGAVYYCPVCQPRLKAYRGQFLCD